ncbi:transposable element Tcb2 transposase [Trichonephila clavipes]|nr:transposable element Tcb2 transposase [Trichonephila clavipes]
MIAYYGEEIRLKDKFLEDFVRLLSVTIIGFLGHGTNCRRQITRRPSITTSQYNRAFAFTDRRKYDLLMLLEDFGKRNMPGKRSRRHFAQLSEFERGLIIGMKTVGWSTCHVAGQVDRSECAVRNCWEQWTQEGGTHTRKTES